MQYAVREALLPERAKLRRWVRAALASSSAQSADITLRIVDTAEGQTLNHDYRGKDYATNVLSFSYAPPPEIAGDLVLCLPVLRKEAHDGGMPIEARFAHLVVHGMLHLQGLEHETDAGAAIMETQERKILARFGYPDPYTDNRLPVGTA